MAQRDEPSALELLRRHAEIVEPLFAAHFGRIVKSLGDGYLVEFSSALEAVACAAAIQQDVITRNGLESDSSKRFSVRIGIHLGDIEHVEGDILGDGVNLASRLQKLAEPGGVCVSEDVFRQVSGRRGFTFRPIGTPPLKNIGRPVELYKMVFEKSDATSAVRSQDALTSIAVLPFANFSSDPENEHFCDGLSDELINALTKIRRLKVVSRTSSFAFKGRERSLSEVGEILGVGIVIEGSVRKVGNRIRVTAQVVDVASDTHLWSETYDRELEDIFAIQDELTAAIVSSLEIAVTPEEREGLARSGTRNIHAYELYLQGMQQYWRFSITGLRAARSLFREAVTLDPDFVLAYSALAQSAAYHFFFWGDHAMYDDARTSADRLLQIAPESAEAAIADGLAHLLAENFEEASKRFIVAIDRAPQSYDAWYVLARCRFAQGRNEEAIEAFLRAADIRSDDYQCLGLAQVACRAMGDEVRRKQIAERTLPILVRSRRLHPDDPRAAYFEASVHTVLGDTVAASECLEQALSLGPHDPSILYNAACIYSLLGKREETLACLEKVARTGFADLDWLVHDMDLATVREDPRFAAVVAMVEDNRRRAIEDVAGIDRPKV